MAYEKCEVCGAQGDQLDSCHPTHKTATDEIWRLRNALAVPSATVRLPFSHEQSDARVSRAMKAVGMENSIPLFGALKQMENEIRHDTEAMLAAAPAPAAQEPVGAKLQSDAAEVCDYLRDANEIEAQWIDKAVEVIQRYHALYARRPEAAAQEPVAWMVDTEDGKGGFTTIVVTKHKTAIECSDRGQPIPLYAAPVVAVPEAASATVPTGERWRAAAEWDAANNGGRTLGPARYEGIHRAMLAAAPAAQEPVAWIDPDFSLHWEIDYGEFPIGTKFYTEPVVAVPEVASATVRHDHFAGGGKPIRTLKEAWAEACGIDVNDERAQEPEVCGWPEKFELFKAGWEAANAAPAPAAQEPVAWIDPDYSLHWEKDYGESPIGTKFYTEPQGDVGRPEAVKESLTTAVAQEPVAEFVQAHKGAFDTVMAFLHRHEEFDDLEDYPAAEVYVLAGAAAAPPEAVLPEPWTPEAVQSIAERLDRMPEFYSTDGVHWLKCDQPSRLAGNAADLIRHFTKHGGMNSGEAPK